MRLKWILDRYGSGSAKMMRIRHCGELVSSKTFWLVRNDLYVNLSQAVWLVATVGQFRRCLHTALYTYRYIQ
jgi:hypothetical protein